MHCNLMLPYVSPSDGGVAAVGAQVGLGVVPVGVEMVTEMTPGLEGLAAVLVIADEQPGTVLVGVDVILVLRVGFALKAQGTQFTEHFPAGLCCLGERNLRRFSLVDDINTSTTSSVGINLLVEGHSLQLS